MRTSLLLPVLLFAAGAAFTDISPANDMIADDDLAHAEEITQAMSRKLVRGVTNIATGWGELPRQMIKAGHDQRWYLSIPVGIPSGLLMTVVRTGIGVVETALFFAPFDGSYDPILEPPFVWQ